MEERLPDGWAVLDGDRDGEPRAPVVVRTDLTLDHGPRMKPKVPYRQPVATVLSAAHAAEIARVDKLPMDSTAVVRNEGALRVQDLKETHEAELERLQRIIDDLIARVGPPD